jgi:hypothetical protein
VTVRDEEGERLLANLGDKRVMLLRNHGILVMGRTLPEAFIKHWSLQRACEIQVATAVDGRAARWCPTTSSRSTSATSTWRRSPAAPARRTSPRWCGWWIERTGLAGVITLSHWEREGAPKERKGGSSDR